MAATYTTPRTWAPGEVVTASLLNTHLRDMMDYLNARVTARFGDYDGTVMTTTSNAFVDVTGSSVNITTSGASRLLVLGNVYAFSNSVGTPTLGASVSIDGTTQGDATYGLAAIRIGSAHPAAHHPFMFITSTTVSAGSHTVVLRVRADGAATLTVQQASLMVTEV